MLLIGESVGIELEVEDVQSGRLNLQTPIIQRVTHDASCEKTVESWNGKELKIPRNFSRRISNSPRRTFGCEIVTGIMDTSNTLYRGELKKICKSLISMGESFQSYRAGFHVHVNCPANLKVLKQIIKLAAHLEQVFFLVGCMGYDYRGKKNDSTYCRPITGKGPVCVPIGNRRFSQVFNINDLLESQTMDNFWERYGNMDIFSTYRYIPVRYHWINLKPMLNQGSLEFRIFNKSLNPNYLWAVIELCKHFVLFAIETSFSLADFPVNSIYNPFTRGSIIETYNEFKSIAKIPEDADKVLLKIMEESDIESIVLPEEYIFTHLLSARSDTPSHFGGTYTPTVINKNLIKYPEYVDSHNFDRVMRTRDNSREEELIDPHVPRPVTLRATPILNSDWAFFTDVPPPRNNNNNGEESTPSIVEEMEEIFEDEYDEENYEEE